MLEEDIKTGLDELAKYYSMEMKKIASRIGKGITTNNPELLQWCVDLRNCCCALKIDAQHYVEIQIERNWILPKPKRYHLSMEFSSGVSFQLSEPVLQKKIQELYFANQVSLWQCGVAVISCITSLINKAIQKAQEAAEEEKRIKENSKEYQEYTEYMVVRRLEE